eukprot:scaffold3058_cov110-Cylindrotheca_fusiformis.AAC.3
MRKNEKEPQRTPIHSHTTDLFDFWKVVCIYRVRNCLVPLVRDAYQLDPEASFVTGARALIHIL